MGKRKKDKRHHDRHHQAIHQYIMRKKAEDGEVDGTPQHHVIPTHQNWHAADTSCLCFPKMVGIPDPQTGIEVWLHSGWIH